MWHAQEREQRRRIVKGILKKLCKETNGYGGVDVKSRGAKRVRFLEDTRDAIVVVDGRGERRTLMVRHWEEESRVREDF